MEEYGQGKVSQIWQDMLGVNMWDLWGHGHFYRKHAWSIHRYIALVDI